MVAIFTGSGLGLERGSGNVLGGAGLLGSATAGRGGGQLFVNAANGNLVLGGQDEFVVGRGGDIAVGRTYNSLGDFSDENGDNWRLSTDRKVFGLTGTVNAAGSSVKRRSADGSEISYSWSGTAYVATDGDGAYDTLGYAAGTWTWTDGSTGTTETYAAYGADWRIVQQRDTVGNTLTFTYAGDKLTQIATADGSTVQYGWSGNNLVSIVTGYTDLVANAARTLTRTRYSYDAYNRLTTVTVDLSPGDNSIADGKVYATSYTYHGTSKRVATLVQTDGTRLEFGYALIGGEQRVTSVKQWVDDANSRVTRLDYDLANRTTIVTDPAGIATRFVYDTAGRLVRLEEAAAAQGGAERISLFAYDSSGNVTWARTYDGAAKLAAGTFGSAIAYRYDANGNVVEQVDGALNTITRTWSATNRLLTETRYTGTDPDGINGALPPGAMTTRFVYDSADRLVYTVSAEGRVTAYQYVNDTPVWVIEYPAHSYYLGGLAPETPLTVSQLDAWSAGIADKSSTQVRQNSYDARGNLIQTIDWGAANANGTPLTTGDYKLTRYVYDQAGQLLSRTVAGMGQESFVHDGLGRLISSTDANGATTLTLYRDGVNQVDRVTIPAGGNLVGQSGWPAAGDGARGANLVDTSHWPEEERGPNLIDLSGWPKDPANVPGGAAAMPGWTNWYAAEAQWVRTIGPDGLPTVVMRTGQADSNDAGGGNHSNLSAIDPTKAYEFSITFQVTELNKHRLYFGLFNDGANPAVLQAHNGTADGNPYFTYPFPGQTPELVAGRWYKIVGYVLPQGSENIAWGSLGGLYDVETGAKLHEVTNFRWNENRSNNNVGVRFFNFYSTGNQGSYTNFYQPEMHQLNFGSGSAQMPGWNAGYAGYVDETRWARMTGPDGKPVWAMQAGQTDPGAEGGGNHTNAITIDGRKAYEFTYYFKKSNLAAHSIYFGVQDNWSGDAYAVQAWNGTVANNPYFFQADAVWQQQNLTADRWYKVVGYVFAEGTQNINWNDYGGVYDTVTGQRITGVSNFRWYEDRPSDQITARFFDFYGESVQGYSTYFYKPEVRAFEGPGPAKAGYAQIPGWQNPSVFTDETSWARITGPDGRPVLAIQSGQTDATAEGGGNYTNSVTIDSTKPYEFSLYFQASATDKHQIYLGLSASSPAYVLNQASGAAETNPYFTFLRPTAAAGYQPGRWYKIVGYVLPQGATAGTASQYGGVYDVETGRKMEGVANFQWSPSRPNDQVHLRFFNYYGEATQGKFTYFYGASLRPVDDYVQSTLEEATLVQSERYNRAGELLSRTESGKNVTGGTATYRYDEAGRLRVATDMRGYKHYYIYDKRGRKVGEAAADASFTEYRYDGDGRLVATVRYSNALGSSGLALLEDMGAVVDVARIRPAANSSDLWSWTVYDKAGRMVEAIEGDGSVTSYEYDGAGRLLRTTGYYNKLSAAQVAALVATPPASMVLPTADAARDSVARSFYDKRGLLLATLDGEGYLTRTVYDGAGQVVEVRAYATAVAANLRAAGTLDQLVASAGTSSADRVTRYVYDGQGLLRYAIDGLNQVTEYGYSEPGAYAYGAVRRTTHFAGAIALPATLTLASVASALATAGLAGAAANRTSYNVYDRAGQRVYSIDAAGAVIGYTYDDLGRVTRTIAFADLRPTTAQPLQSDMDAWALAHAAASLNRVTRNFYNGRGDLLYTVDAEGYVVERGYDADGRVLRTRSYDASFTIADGATAAAVAAAIAASTYSEAQTVYDSVGRVADEYDPLGVRTTYGYRANGQLVWRAQAYGTSDQAETFYAYDMAGRLAAQTEGYGSAEAATTSFAYDGLGNLVSTTDASSRTTSWTHDRLGRQKSETNAASGVTSFEYNAFGEVVRTTDARLNSTWSYYDKLGRVLLARDAEGFVTESGYTAFGELASVKRWFNRATNTAAAGAPPTGHDAVPASHALTRFEYDKIGRLTKTIDAEGGIETSQYDAFGGRKSVTNKLGGVTTRTFDRRGLLEQEAITISGVYGSSYGTLAAIVDNRFEYDARGNLKRTIEADGTSEERTTDYVYDKRNRLISKTGDAVATGLSGAMRTPTETYAYDKRGNLIETRIEAIDGAGARTLFSRTLSYYDDLDRKVAEIDPTGAVRTYGYDAVGNLTTVRAYDTTVTLPIAGGAPPAFAGTFRETTHEYDAVDRLSRTKVVNPLSGVAAGPEVGANFVVTKSGAVTQYLVTEYGYDSAGNVVRTTDPNGGVVHAYYDKLGRRVAQVDQENYLTTWTLDAEGNVLTERRYATRWTGTVTADAQPPVGSASADRITDFTYDTLGRRLTETRRNVEAWSIVASTGVLNPASGDATIVYTYDPLGQVASKREANGDTAYYTYDNAGRLIVEKRASYTDHNGATVEPTVRYFYDALDQLTSTRQGAFATAGNDRFTSNSYAAGRLSATTDAAGFTRNYHYDVAGNLVAERYSRLLASGTSVTEAIVYTRDAAGRVITQAHARLDGSGWVHTDGAGSDYAAIRLRYNAHGELTGRGTTATPAAAAVYQESYDYDSLGRVWRTNAGDGVRKFFVYDPAGNQTLTLTSAGADLSALTLADYTASLTSSGDTGLADAVTAITVYDKRGMAIATHAPDRLLASGGAAVTITGRRSYNAFGEVASETDARGATTSFAYNNMGRLVRTERPTVSITLETGTQLWVKPSEDHYYDISGRLIGTRDANGDYAAGGTGTNGTSKAANTGTLTTRLLLAGTGHGGGEALVVKEFHADGTTANAYDVFGDLRTATDALGRVTSMAYDAMGRLTQVTRPGGLIEHYAYDGLSQRTRHWTSFDTTNVETTDYDAQGRVVRTQAFGGDVTTTSYTWSASLATTGMGTFGGWVETTTYANSRTSIAREDLFGRALSGVDMGGHASSFVYDLAGRMTGRTVVDGSASETVSHAWLNTGLVGTITTAILGSAAVADTTTAQTSTYDANGNKLAEVTTRNGTVIQDATATYDALNRLVTWSEAGNATTPAASMAYAYDANSNVRRKQTSFRYLDSTGAAYGFVAAQDHWYSYDALNRLTVSEGALANGVIGGGTRIGYDAAGQRIRVETVSSALVWTGWRATTPGSGLVVYADDPVDYDWQGYAWTPNGRTTYAGRAIETYSYTADGQLDRVWVSGEQASADGSSVVTANGTMGAAVLRADFAHDALGRVVSQTDYAQDGTVSYSRTGIAYDAAGRVTGETSTTRQGASTLVTHLTYGYGAGAGYALGAVVSIDADTWKDGSDAAVADTRTVNGYGWHGGAVQSSILYTPDTANPSTVYTTSFALTLSGQVSGATIADGRPRSVAFTLDAYGQALRRDEADNNAALGDPHQLWYRFNGREMGTVGNDTLEDGNYASSIAAREAAQGTGPFRNGQNYGGGFARFGEAYVPYTSHAQGAGGGSYTAEGGETLSSLAAQLWGDAGLWYLLAEANGLSGDATLIQGQALAIPAGVTRSSNTAATFKPYDPAEALGNLNPTTPKPQKKKGCGAFGAILMMVVALAVTAVIRAPVTNFITGLLTGSAQVGTAAYAAAAVAGGVIGGAAVGATASSASQLFGMATGIQQGGFNWKGVGLSAIASGVMGGLSAGAFGPEGNVSIFDKLGIGGTGVLATAARAVVGEGISQGIGTATRLQSRFDFAGVAAAGVGALAGAGLGGAGLGDQIIGMAADGLASAAARSLLTGTDFGDNVLAVLPGVVARTIGAVFEDIISGSASPAPQDGAVDPWAPEVWNTLTPGQKWAIISAEYPYSGTVMPDGARSAALAAADVQLQQREQRRVEADARAAGDSGEIVITAKGAPRVLPASHGYDGGRATGTNDVLWLLNNPEADFAGYFRSEYAKGWPDVGAAADAFGKRMLRQVALNGDAWRLERIMPQLAAAAEQDPAFASLRDSAQSYLDERSQLADAAAVEIGNAMIDYGQLTAVGSVLSVVRDGVRGDLSIDPTTMASYAVDVAGRKVRALRNVANGAAETTGPRIIGGIDARGLVRSHSIEGNRSIKNVDQISDIMRNDGYAFDPIDVIEHNGGMIIVDGHHRTAAAIRTNTPVTVRVVGPDQFPMGSGGWQSIDEVIQAAPARPNRLNPPGRRR